MALFLNERQSRPFVAVSKFNCKIGVRRKEREIEENKAAYMFFSRLFCFALLLVHNRHAKPWLYCCCSCWLCLLGFKGYLTFSACGLSSSHFLDRYFSIFSPFWLGPSSSISVCMLSRVRRFMRTSQKTLLHGVHSPAKSWVFQTRPAGKQAGRR